MKIVCCTGGFDPIHSGHIEYLNSAKKLGDILVVGINSDDWLTRKKGRPFITFNERVAIVGNLKCVDMILPFDDTDGSAIDLINQVKIIYPNDQIIFANGGDRTVDNIPEMDVKGVIFKFGVGGGKTQSSSWILSNYFLENAVRDWGNWKVLREFTGVKIKELYVEPGKSLSYQRHFERNEFWFVCSGTGQVVLDSNIIPLTTNQTIEIPTNAWHQLQNTGSIPLIVLEIQWGTKCVEEDIERM